MATYIKNTTHYGIYLIESDATNNDNWIGVHAGDPGEADIDLYTDGNEYIRIDKIDENDDNENYGVITESLIDGITETFITGEEANIYTIRGTLHASTLTAMYALGEKVKSFCKRHNRHATKQAYLVNRYGATSYEKFFDEDITELKYARGYVIGRRITYSEGALILNVVIGWRIAWT